ncbi:MAG: 3-deoxy-manno-octulosonate cytidylyltransferase [Bacteroidales bacterium]|jgi:3-deoxy-manno-octulosonate cytidylyltransferase (CMP-KDO synthetase)|nr:3-deoxy-manno-octulosonate cytidylyltransferase [Bacteroidales bacterium]MCI1732897.1 3-deoxy-manno-octulosonate cytidylyltransferase [Bacteroidales bacterium]
MRNVIAIIPARYASTRFPGKPLAMVNGVPMIVRVVRQAEKVFKDVCVATDDERIFNKVLEMGGKAVMTSASHSSGTDRCLEALTKYQAESGKIFDVIINVQGDEPYIRPEQLKRLIDCFDDEKVEIATLVKKCGSVKEVNDPNRPKVVIDKDWNALYFSRSVIPFFRGGELSDEIVKNGKYYLHIGLYGYTAKALSAICAMPQGVLEKTEKLEQLRWLENGYKIRVAESNYESYSVDTQEDLDRLNKMNIE